MSHWGVLVPYGLTSDTGAQRERCIEHGGGHADGLVSEDEGQNRTQKTTRSRHALAAFAGDMQCMTLGQFRQLRVDVRQSTAQKVEGKA